ncbi:c-type cytochrome [Nioella nitratireducens]|uniref:c-type cytochrome n=1 Tax=Nioella nitratireducens TaxID=1287720 RepID=UPI000A01D341|nr:c-type cytochrome [Nioella nitratireducens]
MIRKLTFATAILAAPMAFADGHGDMSGDPEAGAEAFNTCITCHVVRNPAGEVLAGRNGRVGPNLYGLPGRTAGSVEDFRYSPLMQAAHDAELVWTEEHFVSYVPNASAFLTEFTGERGRSTMTPQPRISEEDAANIYAFLASLVEEDTASE